MVALKKQWASALIKKGQETHTDAAFLPKSPSHREAKDTFLWSNIYCCPNRSILFIVASERIKEILSSVTNLSI